VAVTFSTEEDTLGAADSGSAALDPSAKKAKKGVRASTRARQAPPPQPGMLPTGQVLTLSGQLRHSPPPHALGPLPRRKKASSGQDSPLFMPLDDGDEPEPFESVEAEEPDSAQRLISQFRVRGNERL
jgi:hypothetical protein